MPPPKSAGTCVPCRARKVRCKGGPPCCSNCQRLAFACSFAGSPDEPPGGSPSPSSTTPPRLEKRRRPLACRPCRASKSRCTGERPSCAPCRARRRTCAYPEPKGRKPSLPGNNTQCYAQAPPAPPSPGHGAASRDCAISASSPPASASSIGVASPGDHPAFEPSLPLPPVREQLRMVDDYFRHIYAHPGCAFLSEVAVTKHCLDGTLDEALLLALCALTASTLKHPRYHPSHSASWVHRAEGILWNNMESPTVLRTQALLLAVLCRVEMGNAKRGYMLLSMASRAASAMRLQYERLDLGHQSQEVRRRLAWCIMLIDSYFSVGLPESATCPPDFIYVKMPCPEEEFVRKFVTGPASVSPDGPPEGGLLPLYLRFSIIRRDVMRLSRHLALEMGVGASIAGLVEDMLKALRLAEPPRYSAEELRRYANSRWLARYIAVQIAWHQAHCDIYRLFLAGYREAAPEAVIRACAPAYVAQAATACLEHARMVSEIIEDVGTLRPPLVSPPRDIAIGGYHASRLLLFLSNSNLIPRYRNATDTEATSRARGTLAVLRLLFSASAILGQTVEDLDRIVALHVSGAAGETRGVYGEDERDRRRPARYAVSMQRHASLAVHSALRHAQFHEGGDEDGDDGDDFGPAQETRWQYGQSLL